MPRLRDRPRVLFVCYDNACRSQMAEGFARSLGPGWEVASAGHRPARRLERRAVLAMRRAGVDISRRRPKALAGALSRRWDALVSMGGGDSWKEVSARWRLDWPVSDPRRLSDAGFDAARDEVAYRVRMLAEALGAVPRVSARSTRASSRPSRRRAAGST